MRPVQPQRHVLHPRATHREVERYQVALLQGAQLLATRHGHDDPPAGLLLDLFNCVARQRDAPDFILSSHLIFARPESRPMNVFYAIWFRFRATAAPPRDLSPQRCERQPGGRTAERQINRFCSQTDSQT